MMMCVCVRACVRVCVCACVSIVRVCDSGWVTSSDRVTIGFSI